METAHQANNASATAPIALRPLGLGEILDLAITLYRKNFLTLIGISAVIAVPLLILQILAAVFALPSTPFSFSRATTAPTSLSTSMLLFYVAIIAISILNSIAKIYEVGAIAAAIAEQYLGRAITIKQAYLTALRRWLSLLSASILVGLAALLVFSPFIAIYGLSLASVMGGASQITAALGLAIICLCFLSIPLLILWIYLSTNWAFFTQAIVLENSGGTDGLRRSWQLVKGSFWRVWLTLVLLTLFIFIITAVPTYTIQFGASMLFASSLFLPTVISSVITTVIATLIQPLQSAVLTLLYFDLRIRKEGFDLQVTMQQLEPTPTASV